MIRRGCAKVRWASLRDPAASPQLSCRWCQQSRTVFATRSSLQEENAVTNKSAMDELFDAPDAFDHDVGVSQPQHSTNRQGKQSQKVPRTVLGNDLSNNIASQLNQEWEGSSSGKRYNMYRPSPSSSSSSSSTRGGMPLRGPEIGEKKRSYKGTMTPSETKTFNDIFGSFFSGVASQSSKPVDEGAFGSSLTSNMPDTLIDFRSRHRLQEKRRAATKRYLSSVLSERVLSANISEDEIEAKIDEAREEIVGCSSVSELWQWAAKNVWGIKGKEQQQQAMYTMSRGKSVVKEDEVATKSAGKEVGESEDVEEEARFGMASLYYSPVLLLLLTNLRDRFNSPHSALSILRITKNLGPDSFVLGCSPQLYAEAIRTQWVVLRDLEGARDTLREAKDTGVLGRGAASSSPVQPLTTNGPTSRDRDEETRLREIVSRQLKSEVQTLVIEGVKRLPDGQTPLVYERQLELIADMDKILGTYQRPVSPARRSYQPRRSSLSSY